MGNIPLKKLFLCDSNGRLVCRGPNHEDMHNPRV